MSSTCAIILYNKNGKVLLQHRDTNAPDNANKWSFFGGGIEKGETPEQCVIRECYEEITYKLSKPRLVFIRNIGGEKQYIFIEKFDESKEIIQKEGDKFGWFSFDEIGKLDRANFIDKILREIKEKIPNIKT